MSEEKLYVVKNDEGKYWDFIYSYFWRQDIADCLATPSIKQAELVADEYGGHVVALIEEPEKPVLPKGVADEIQQAKDMRLNFYMYIIKFAKDSATCDFAFNNFLADVSDEQFKILADAWYNGYTVEKESRYMVYVPGTNKKFLYNKRGDRSTRAAKLETPIVPSPVTSCQTAYGQYKPLYWFTDEEIEHYGLQDCEKEEVNEDEQ